MGGGRWDDTRYHSDRSSRLTSGVADFNYTKTASKAHDSLDPKRINKKPFEKLEARDSTEHPDSNAVLVCFDVTGSNHERAIDAQQKLPNLMALVAKYLSDPQVAVAANDDYKVVGRNAIQISDFESDNRIDEHIRNIWLVGNGGGNAGESYDLLLYAAARKTVLDCFEKRGRKGYLFLYADEPIFEYVDKHEVEDIFGDKIEGDIPIAEIIEEARRQYHVFMLWPKGGYDSARKQYVELFGDESVVTLQHPNMICEMIGSIIGLNEERVSIDGLSTDLVAVGATGTQAGAVTAALVPLAKERSIAKASGSLPAVEGGKGKAARL